jgi:hypothetical protein
MSPLSFLISSITAALLGGDGKTGAQRREQAAREEAARAAAEAKQTSPPLVLMSRPKVCGMQRTSYMPESGDSHAFLGDSFTTRGARNGPRHEDGRH